MKKSNNQERKYTIGDLRQFQSMSLQAKVNKGVRLIEDFSDQFDSGVYVSNSGGKDSMVLTMIADMVMPDIPKLYVRTGLEYPEVDLMASIRKNTVIRRPEISFKNVLTLYGYPVISKDTSKIIYGARNSTQKKARQNYLNRLDGLDSNGNYDEYKQMYKKYKFLLDAPFEISNRCCYYMKERPAMLYEQETGRKAIIGTQADESAQRRAGWLKSGCNAFDGSRPISKPLSVWTEQDILHYLKDHEDELMEKIRTEVRERLDKEELTANERQKLETFLVTQKHPWASVYGDIVPKLDKSQCDGQISLCDFTGDYDNQKLKTTGCDRTGCMFCLYGAHCGNDQRFVRMRSTHPKIFDYVMRGGKFNEKGMWIPSSTGLGYEYVINWLNEHGGLNIQY